MRLLPRDKAARALQPAGIEFTPPRVERSTGPGRHDFEIVADSEISLEQDMERRDFTINAIARRLETGEILDPLGGRADLERGVLRTTGPASFRDDPLRIVRGLRFVSQLDVDPDEDTLRQMREWAPRIEHVSGERIGGGLAADGMGELSKLLLGAHPAKALRLARDTGVLVHVLPEFAPAIGYEQQSGCQHLHARRARLRRRPGGRRRGRRRWRCGSRRCCTTSGSPRPSARAATTPRSAPDRRLAGAGPAPLSDQAAHVRRQARAGAPVPRSRTSPQPVDARRFLARHGERLAFDLLAHRAADLAGKTPCRRTRRSELDRFRALVEQERTQPHRLADLAVDGARPDRARATPRGRSSGGVADLLDEVVEDPERNERDPAPRPGDRNWRDPLGRAGPYEVVFSTREGGVSEGPVRVAQPRPDDR